MKRLDVRSLFPRRQCDRLGDHPVVSVRACATTADLLASDSYHQSAAALRPPFPDRAEGVDLLLLAQHRTNLQSLDRIQIDLIYMLLLFFALAQFRSCMFRSEKRDHFNP